MAALRFVSTNEGKYREVRAILREYGIDVVWLQRELAEPQADRLEAVVSAKLAALPRSAHDCLVEDSGLFIDSLGGFPGVYSAYIYRTVGLEGILRLLDGLPRNARFRTVAGVREGGASWTVSGETRGTIARQPRGSNGFGYDPIFVPAGARRTFAQMEPTEKNRLSHRAQAIRRVGRRLSRRRSRRPKQM